MNEATSPNQLSARRLLADYIKHMGGKTVVDRPFNVPEGVEWTVNQQISSAVLQVKKAIRYTKYVERSDVSFEADDDVAQSAELSLIGINRFEIDVPSLKTNPALFKLAVRTFAEVAGVDPNKVTTGIVLKVSFFMAVADNIPLAGKFINAVKPELLKPEQCIAVADAESAAQLIHFARTAVFQGGYTEDKMNFKL